MPPPTGKTASARISLELFNRQKTRALDLTRIKKMVRQLVPILPGGDSPKNTKLAFHFVAAAEMADLNQTFLQHAGSTDVITFDYTAESDDYDLCGEIFICLDEVVAAAPRFRVHWTKELARYVIHGLLHLRGFDDQKAAPRRAMKKWENLLLRRLSRGFNLATLERAKHGLPRT